MRSAPEIPAVLDACSVPGRRERLDAALLRLELCERALQGYLEAKRVAFPRFYFVSPADLLDLLAHGDDPRAACRHLPKIFDNMHRLEWKEKEEGQPGSNIAVGMYSGEGEYVPFAAECECTGAVEVRGDFFLIFL
jgi:dynein heavy chain, axonemal